MQRLPSRLWRGPHLPPITISAPRDRGMGMGRDPGMRTAMGIPTGAALALPLCRRYHPTPAQNEAEKAGQQAQDARGRTGGGKPLHASENPPPQPKINNASVPGTGKDKLTPEQQKEVDQHNAEFEKKHDRAAPAAQDKVDKSFWSGRGERGPG